MSDTFPDPAASAEASHVDLLMVLPHLTAGGAERVSILLAHEFIEQGLTVHVAVFRKFGRFQGELDPRIPVHQAGGAGSARAVLPLARLIRRLRPKAVMGVMVTPNMAAALAARLSGRRPCVVLTEHNQVDRNAAYFGTAAYRLIRWIYPLADKVVCVSDGVRESLLRFTGLPDAGTTVVHNPIVSPHIEALAAQPCGHPWLDDPRVPVVLAVGRLTEAKDYPMLLRAFAALRDRRPARLIILGAGPERETMEAVIADLGIAGDVDMPGFSNNPYAFMARASVFALSSAWEGFPTVLVEALACGAPVVATDCRSGPREILEDGALGPLTPVGDHDAFASALERVIDNPGDREARRQRAAVFSVARAAEIYRALLFGRAA
jgi:glycosyltransferase involved in cell wall biosynthesis